MHPSKFLGRAIHVAPVLSNAERLEQLEAISVALVSRRKEAVDARKSSGIEEVWRQCEEAYLGIDDMNRSEFANARWAKPTTMEGGLTSSRPNNDEVRSSAFVRLTSRYVDAGTAKLAEILLPIDDKAFSLSSTPDPELVKQAKDLAPLMDGAGAPLMRQLTESELAAQASQQAAPQPQPGAAPTQPGQPPQPGQQNMTPMTAGDKAQQIIDQASDSAKKAETRIYDWLVESKYPAEARKVVGDAGRLGSGVLKSPFPDVRTERAITRAGNVVALQFKKSIKPAVRWVDLWNLFPDESCGEDIHEGEYIFERDFMSGKMLRKLKGQQGYLDEQIEKVLEEGPGKINLEGVNPNDKNASKKRYEIWYYYGVLKRSELEVADTPGIEDVPEDQEEVHAVVTIVNDTVIRAIINPMDSGCFPYRLMTWSRRAGSWAGVGIAEQISTPQRIVNASTRALLNNAGISSGVQIVIDQAGIVPADGKYHMTPNKVWFKTADASQADVRALMQIMSVPNVYQEMMGVIEYGMKLAEESSGIPLVTQGQTGPTSPETFGQAELQDNNAHTWIRSVGYRYDDQITEPLINDMYEWLLLDPAVPDEEKGDFSIYAHGSIAMVERAIQESVIMGMLNAAQNPAFKIDPAKLFALYLKAKRMDPRDVQYTKEQQAQMDAQPPAPPLPIALEQVKGQNAIQLQQAKAQTELQTLNAEMQHDQQQLQTGGMTPHMAQAQSRIAAEEIRANTAQAVEASRANAEQARAEKELTIARENGWFDLRKMELQKELALLQYAQNNNLKLQDVQAQLANTALQERTKRELGAAEIQLAASEGDKDRTIDLHKHASPSLVRDQISTPNTP